MTDTFDVRGDMSPAPSHDTVAADSRIADAHQTVTLAPNGFLKFGLAAELIRAVEDLGFTQPTPVQDETIPLAMPTDDAGKFTDLMVSSQTGSGKTAAFLLPMLHTLLQQQVAAEAAARAEYEREAAAALAKGEDAPKRAKRKDPTNPRNFKAAAPGALILCPTRELAQQVAHDAIDLVRHCRGLRVANVIGGMPYQLQIAKLQNADLVIATPGRLLDLQRSSQIKLDKVQFLVVDEADRMLDLGFADDLAEINQLTIERRQTMMFSATFAARIQQLAARVMRQPRKIQIDNPQERHVNIKQVLFWADSAQHKR
ncbi:MAG TPA: DEAD/DEAH box helicase, partial [Ramlibacter sp.]|nr:DEAD/DEAH box helicase [Ramlibacter sp.]